VRGKAYLKTRKCTYSRYSEAAKSAAVRAYLSGGDANTVAARFGMLRTQSIYVRSHDERYRGGIAMEDEKKAKRTNGRVQARSPQEGMSPEEELQYLRMENSVLKKLDALRSERRQPRKK